MGKSELAKTLASYYFGSEDAMVRLDMSEFMERHTVSKLIGSPPGAFLIAGLKMCEICALVSSCANAVPLKDFLSIVVSEIAQGMACQSAVHVMSWHMWAAHQAALKLETVLLTQGGRQANTRASTHSMITSWMS